MIITQSHMKTRIILLLFTILSLTQCYAQINPRVLGIAKETHVFAVKDGEELTLDTYLDSSAIVDGKRPVFVYVFGGAWENGSKENGTQIAQFFAKEGFLGVSINYRLGIKKYKKDHGLAQNGFPAQDHFADAYSYAIDLGVEDLFDATRYIIDNAEKWNIDTEKIILCGSSAGAINSVTAEWMICNEMPLAKSHLPEGFNYGGVISQAGGVWKRGPSEPTWKNAPCPFLFFHGTKDQLVPYSSSSFSGIDFGAFGGGFLKEQFKANKFPHYSVTVEDADHMIAMLPQSTSLHDMLTFYIRFVERKQNIVIEATETYFDKAPTMFSR